VPICFFTSTVYQLPSKYCDFVSDGKLAWQAKEKRKKERKKDKQPIYKRALLRAAVTPGSPSHPARNQERATPHVLPLPATCMF